MLYNFRSERVCKSNLTGVLLTEAKCINLSLHYLEQVIIALTDKNRSHIPYRNSMLTMMLRDSLGGNCMTSMIATISSEMRDAQVSFFVKQLVIEFNFRYFLSEMHALRCRTQPLRLVDKCLEKVSRTMD